MKIVQMPKYPCSFCKKNEATQFCDFVVNYYWTSLKDERGRLMGRQYQTCDNQLCKTCLVKVSSSEFCPSCHKLYLMIQKEHDRRGSRLMIDTVMGELKV